MGAQADSVGREGLQSRLGFLMVAAGCAVGLGNVWRFPFIVGRNGGAAFVLVYLVFLALLGFPLLAAELAVGRAAKKGVSGAMRALAPERTRWFWYVVGCVVFAGNVLLMAYYTSVGGWLLRYTAGYATQGVAFTGGGAEATFNGLLADSATCTLAMLAAVSVAVCVCLAGVQRGVERVTKWMMLSLLALLGVLAAKALSLPGAAKGVAFYLRPDWTPRRSAWSSSRAKEAFQMPLQPMENTAPASSFPAPTGGAIKLKKGKAPLDDRPSNGLKSNGLPGFMGS